MRWEIVKHVLLGIPEELSLRERKIAMKIGLTVLGILTSVGALVYLLSLRSEFKTGGINIFHILLLTAILFVAFTCFELVFRKKGFFVLVKIFLLFLFVFCLLYLGYSYSPLVAKLGWLSLLGWIIYFIKAIFCLVKDFSEEKDIRPSEEKTKSGLQSVQKKDWWGSRNLGFKGFIWAILFFVVIILFVYLFGYLTK